MTKRVLAVVAGILVAVIGGGWVAWFIAGGQPDPGFEAKDVVVASRAAESLDAPNVDRSTPVPPLNDAVATPDPGTLDQAFAQLEDDAELELPSDERDEAPSSEIDASDEPPPEASAEGRPKSSSRRVRSHARRRPGASLSSSRARRTRRADSTATRVPVVFRLDGVRLAYVRVDGRTVWALEPRKRARLPPGRHRIEYRTSLEQPWKSGGTHDFVADRSYVVRIGARGAAISSSRGS